MGAHRGHRDLPARGRDRRPATDRGAPPAGGCRAGQRGRRAGRRGPRACRQGRQAGRRGRRACQRGGRPANDGALLPPAGAQADPLAPEPDGAAVLGAPALASITAPGGGAAPGGGGPEAEGSPLLEFTHPLLALTGLTFWIFFVMTDDRLFAWIAFGVVAATVLAGLSWAMRTRRAARAGREPVAFPPHLLMIHGLAAACTLTLVVISAVTAAHA